MSGFSNAGPNRRSLWDHQALVAGTYRERVKVAGWSDFMLQWIQWVAAGTISSITVFSSSFTNDPATLDDLDPAANPAWTDETPYGAIFGTLPLAALGSDRLLFHGNPFMYLNVEIVVATDVSDFSLVARGQGRAG